MPSLYYACLPGVRPCRHARSLFALFTSSRIIVNKSGAGPPIEIAEGYGMLPARSVRYVDG